MRTKRDDSFALLIIIQSTIERKKVGFQSIHQRCRTECYLLLANFISSGFCCANSIECHSMKRMKKIIHFQLGKKGKKRCTTNEYKWNINQKGGKQKSTRILTEIKQ